MRTLAHLWMPHIEELSAHWSGGNNGMQPAELFEVELGLTALSDLLPGSPAFWLCHLLRGYTYGVPQLLHLSAKQRQALTVVRTILLAYKNERVWREQLERYRAVEDRFRSFEIDEQHVSYTRKSVTVAAKREELYEQILASPLPYQLRNLQWAEAGKTYICADQHRRVSVTIPNDVPIPPPCFGHALPMRSTRTPLSIPWSELEETARWMDKQEEDLGLFNDWAGRLGRVTLEVALDEKGDFTVTNELSLNGIHNFVGIVSAGKSTLMDIVAVWAAQHGKRVTLVVGDVVDIFTRVRMFRRFGLEAAPVFGLSNREEHTNRLFRVLTTREELHPFLLDPSWFKYTSSSCLLDGLREGSIPFLIKPQPCLDLHQISRRKKTKGEPEKKSYACPFFSVCPYHLAQRELVQANIWIATPASLVYSRVASQLNAENLTFLELACLRSDLIIVDEADRVQMQLDQMFSPSQTLMRKGRDSWLGYLLPHVNEQLSAGGCRQVREESVRKWACVLNVASTALQSLYNLLQAELSLYSWLKADLDYFSPLTILEKLSVELSGKTFSPSTSPFEDSEVQDVLKKFNEFLNDPLAEDAEHVLGLIAQEALVSARAQTRSHLQQWLKQNVPRLQVDPGIGEYALRLHFALMLCVLSHCLTALVNNWKQVEVVLGLEGGNNVLFHRPPEDFAPLVPDTPMGNILGFQYIPVEKSPQEAGELRFFRCMGVGRALLLHLHELFDASGFCGPHVMLLSGTSWAGSSPSYHIQLPVSGVLRVPEEDMERINETTFELRRLKSVLRQESLYLSGKRPGQDSISALEEMLDALSRRDRLVTSILEQERAALPPGRQRILLLVGSYPEARRAYEYLAEKRDGWRDQMKYLVPDDEQFTCEWRGYDPRLQRGIVSQFARSDAWLLIAPLMAVERGHNILNDQQVAALGAVFFLKRPHPRPNDISYHMHCINHWAIKYAHHYSWLAAKSSRQSPSLVDVARTFHQEAYTEWRRLLRLPLIQKTMLPDDKRALVWSQLVSIWQVIGRLLRGGCPARVIFCDASFAEVTTEETPHLCAGPLWEMLQELSLCFENGPSTRYSQRDKALVRMLYEPLYRALSNITVR
jgi:hypothetical protein